VTTRSAFVTGAYGLLGSWLVRSLLERGDRVTVLRRDRPPHAALRVMGLETRVAVVEGDICDQAVVERALAEYEVDTVFHLAAQTIVGTAKSSPVPTFEANVKGTWSVLEAARRTEVARVVVASSDKAYGASPELPYTEDLPLRAQYPYDVSKAAADMIARSYASTYGLPVAVTRFANLYGGGDTNQSRLVPEVVRAVLTGTAPVIRSDGTPERDFLYVEDAVGAYLAIADALDEGVAVGQAYNAGAGRSWSVAEVVRTICQVAGTELQPDIRGKGTPHAEIDRQFVSAEKIARDCGWKPAVELADGLRRTVDWYRAHPEVLGLPASSSA
jgi:CDP-glucose 4,6-dehydratase